MSLWRLSRQSEMGSLIWLRTPGVALAALVYPRLPSLTASWSVPNPRNSGMDQKNDQLRTLRSVPHMSNPALQVVNAYNRIVYGRGTATDSDLNAATKVWQVMYAQ